MGGLGSGNHLDPILRRLIYFQCIDLHKTPEEIYEFIFPPIVDISKAHSWRITFRHLCKLCTWFTNGDSTEIDLYLYGSNTRASNAGRPRSLKAEDREHLRAIIRERCTKTLHEIVDELYLMIENEVDQMSSMATVSRELHKLNYTRKVFI